MERPILVAVDFSRFGREALDEAIRLAQGLGAPVRIVHVLPRPVEQTIAGGTIDWEMLREITQTEEVEEARTLSQEWAEVVRAAGIDVDAEVRPHPAVDGILAAIDEHEPSMLVVGSRGRSGFKKWVLGSVATKVAQRSPIPVLVVPAKGA